MKSYFSRSFLPGMALLMTALLLLGTAFQLLLRNYLQNDALNNLESDGNTIVRLTRSYLAEDALTGHEFLVNISLVAQLSEADTVICDEKGFVLLCSDAPLGCDHQGMQLNAAFLQQVFSQKKIKSTGMIHGLYEDERYVVALPITSRAGTNVGIVVVSKAIADTTLFVNRLIQIYITVSVLVIFFSLLVMTLIARRQSSPLQEMARAANAFGHGDLSARVSVSPRQPREVQELALSFNNMAVSLEKSEEQWKDFVANVSHELTTPMTSISGYVDGILDGTIPPEQQKHYMEVVSKETKRLSRLVRSMLDMSKLQAQEGIPESQKSRFDITECAGLVLLSFERKITEKEILVDVRMPEHAVYTFANQDYITQVIYNLVDNAVKFCPPQGSLVLQLREGTDKLYLSIINDGNTIPPEELPLVFDRFRKLDKSRSLDKEGWGLGLYIVKTIVNCHGENISVSSREGKTDFTFTLPLVR